MQNNEGEADKAGEDPSSKDGKEDKRDEDRPDSADL